MEKWVSSRVESSYWMPYSEYRIGKYISAIFERTHIAPMIWGRPKITDTNEIYNIAKELYENEFSDLPITCLEFYNK